MAAPYLVDDATVARTINPKAMLDVIAGALAQPIAVPQRLANEVIDSTGQSRALLAMSALRPDGLGVVKIVSARRGLRSHLDSRLHVFDPDGQLLAMVAADTLTALRTAAQSVLAARLMGAGQARHMAVLGAGRQARAQMEAFASALPIERISIWARRVEARIALANEARRWAQHVELADSVTAAVAHADIVTAATPSTEPLIEGRLIAHGTHIDLIGGFRPDMREADDALVGRAAVVADCHAALIEAGDLVGSIASGFLAAGDVRFLTDLLGGQPITGGRDITLFKSVGHAALDLVAAELVVKQLGLMASQPAAQSPLPEPAGMALD